MSRHGPSRSASTCCAISVPTSMVRRSAGQALARVRGRIARIGDRHHHGPALRRVGDALSDLLFEEIGPAFGKFFGRDRDGLRRRQQRPAHHVFGAGTVDKDEAVDAVEPLLRVAAGPRRALRPIAEFRELRMCRDESRHCVRLLAPRRAQQLVEGLWCRDREERGVDHSAAPFLSVRSRDSYPQAPHAHRRVRRVRIGGAEIEAPEHRILPATKKPGPATAQIPPRSPRRCR